MTDNSRLFYLIGPSGVGKDTILTHLKQQQCADLQPLVAHRYITRPVRVDDENHVELTQSDFNRRKQKNLFLFNWESHGCQYGVGIEIEKWLQAGNSVIVNGSRQYLNQAQKILPGLVPICLTVSENVLRQRLQQRGREKHEQIEARIQRNKEISASLADDCIVIENDQSVDATIAQLMTVIDSSEPALQHGI